MSEALKLKPLDIDLIITAGPHQGERFSFKDKDIIKIGRDPENDIILASDLRTSRFHAEIIFSDESFYVYNRAQKNYILINGIKDEQALVSTNTKLTIGETEIKVILPQITTPVVSDVTAIQFKTPASHLTQVNTKIAMPNNLPPIPTAIVNSGTLGSQKIKSPYPRSKKNNNTVFYLAIAGVMVIGFFLFTRKEEEKVKSTPIVTPILQDEAMIRKSLEDLEKVKERMKNLDSRKIMARQFLVSGMREYNNGQYQRAIDYLASAFQSDPTLEDAAKYHLKSKQKLEKLIDHSFLEGKKYKESNNYRMCKASFQTVLFFIKNNMKHPRYIEAKQFYDECSSLEEIGRY